MNGATEKADIQKIYRRRCRDGSRPRCSIELLGKKALILLPCGARIKIDRKDVKKAILFAWSLGGSRENNKYVKSCNWIGNGKKRTFLLHHLLLKQKKGFVIDHIDGDTTNNLRSNLRYVPLRYNGTNSRPRKRASSGYTAPLGVTLDKKKGWRVRVSVGKGISKHVGWFKTIEEASIVARKAHLEAHGKYSVYARKDV